MTSTRRSTVSSVVVAFALALAGCGDGTSSDREPRDVVARAVLPAGDSGAGRQAFIDLKCGACHAVPSEPSFAAPISASPGPPIDGRVASEDVSYLITAIMTPSHELSPRVSEEVRQHLTGTLSPMGDFSQVMTVRQAVDLHAYIQSRSE